MHCLHARLEECIKLLLMRAVDCVFVCVFQLLKLYEHLVSPLAQGVVQLVEEFGCRTIVREIVREISSTDTSDLMQDTSGTRAYSQFLVEVAERVPELIVPAINALAVHLEGEVCFIILVLVCTCTGAGQCQKTFHFHFSPLCSYVCHF